MMWLYRLASWLMPRIPLGVAYRLAEVAGDLLWLASPVRARVEHNQRRALPPGASEREVARSSREVLRNLTKIYVDEFRIPAVTPAELEAAVSIQGLEHLEAALARGKGVILTSAHYGAPQIVGQLLAMRGYPTTVVVEHLQPEELFQFMCELRQSHGVRLAPVDKPLIGLIRTLRKENGIVGLVVDRNVTGTGIRLPFLGEELLLPDGAIQLALRTGAPLLSAFCRRRPGGRYEATVQPPLPLAESPPAEEMDEAVREGTTRLMARLEAVIREEPGQWVMTVPLWDGEGAA